MSGIHLGRCFPESYLLMYVISERRWGGGVEGEGKVL